MKRPMPLLIPCGCSPSHTQKESEYYFRALVRNPWTEHDILLARWRLRLALEVCDERKVCPLAH
jgi:hypothetical protein